MTNEDKVDRVDDDNEEEKNDKIIEDFQHKETNFMFGFFVLS